MVYDASAFKLPDGSMLDDLIRQMPGVKMNDNGEIFVNNRKVDEVLLGARSFMGGNSKVLLENLPYYTVKNVKVYEKETDRMKRAFEAYINGKSANSKNLYSTLSGISDAARRTLAECSLIGWQSGGHSNGYVPVFAIGAGSEAFAGKIDNTQIPYRIAKAAGWKVPEGEDK